MKSVAVLFGAAALALTITAASAEDVESANYMLPGCRNLANRRSLNEDFTTVFTAPFCAGIVHGTTFMGMFAKLNLKSSPVPDGRPMRERGLTCIDVPDGVTPSQEVRVVVAYIEARPARMHESFTVLALEALRDAWLCR